MEEMKQVLDNISEIYRDSLKQISILDKKICDIELKLKDTKSLEEIRYIDYSNLKTNLDIFKSRLIKEQSKSEGIFIVREEVLNAYCKMQNV